MSHDDVITWKHFPRNWPFVRGIHRSPVNSPQGQWRGALLFSLICARINGWVNNGEAGDLRRYRANHCNENTKSPQSAKGVHNSWDILSHTQQRALLIFHGHFNPNNSQKTLLARPLGRGLGLFREFEVWPKFNIWRCSAVCNCYDKILYARSRFQTK